MNRVPTQAEQHMHAIGVYVRRCLRVGQADEGPPCGNVRPKVLADLISRRLSRVGNELDAPAVDIAQQTLTKEAYDMLSQIPRDQAHAQALRLRFAYLVGIAPRNQAVHHPWADIESRLTDSLPARS